MTVPDLLRIVDHALEGQGPAALADELLRRTVDATGARYGILQRELTTVASWPEQSPPAVEAGDPGWEEMVFDRDEERWILRLFGPKTLEESVLAPVRLTVRAWNLAARLKRSRFDERFRLWELEAIRAIATSIGGVEDRTALAEELVAHLVALLGPRSAALFLESDEVPSAGFGPDVLDSDAVRRARNQAITTDDVLAVPLTVDQGSLGVLVVAYKEAREGTEAFNDRDRRLLELFALQVSVALEYARLARESVERDRLRREMEVAATIQGHLLPQSLPEFEGIRIHARSNPTRHVAGDTHDILVHDDALIVTVTDVSGKGVGAGLIASGVQAGVRLLAPEGFELDDLARRLNTFLHGATGDNRFATFAMVRIERDGRLAAVNAGHCPILIRKRDGRVVQIASSGLPLGILPDARYSTETLQMEPGDTVFLYTDGLTEAEDPTEEEFSQRRLTAAVADAPCDEGPNVAADAVFDAVEAFTRGTPLHDDATLVVVQWGEPGPRGSDTRE